MNNPAEALLAGAATFAERSALYGDNYQRFGAIMQALFPAGLAAHNGDQQLRQLTKEDWNRLGVLVQCVSKLTRYAEQFGAGGHRDSAHDLMVYAAMLEHLTE